MDRLDKIMQIAEELSHTRSQVENTMVGLKTQLRYLSNAIGVRHVLTIIYSLVMGLQ